MRGKPITRRLQEMIEKLDGDERLSPGDLRDLVDIVYTHELNIADLESWVTGQKLERPTMDPGAEHPAAEPGAMPTTQPGLRRLDTDELVAGAKATAEQYGLGEGDISFDDAPAISRAHDGAHVQAWLWVGYPAVDA